MQIKLNPDAGLTRDQLSGLAELLMSKRQQLEECIAGLNRAITARRDCSIADAAEAANQYDEAFRASNIAKQQRQTLVEIDHAVQRLEKGQYGISEKTGEPIGYSRLSVVPWARESAKEGTQ